MLIVEVCRQFGWSYQVYLEQPNWFIDMILEKMKIDAKKEKSKK